MRQPWSKFYWADWRSDPQLRLCGLAARGLWLEILALMNEAEPYGHLVVSGNTPTDTQLGALVGAPPSQIPDLLGELERAGVFSRTRKGAIYSRRMLRDDKKAKISRKNGKLGGNPKLLNQTQIPPPDNQRQKPPDKTQMPEAREERKTSERFGNRSSSAANGADGDPRRLIFGDIASWLAGEAGRSLDATKRWLGKAAQAYGDGNLIDAVSRVRSGPYRNDVISALTADLERISSHGGKRGRQQPSATSNLYAGAAIAIARRESAQREADRGADLDAAEPLLDLERPAGNPRATNRRLD